VLDFVQESFHGCAAGGERAGDLKHLVELALVDHHPCAAGQVTVADREEAHEGCACGVNRGLAKEYKPTLGRQIAMEANIFAHHTRYLWVSSEGR